MNEPTKRQANDVTIDVAVCTYRRSTLEQTLHSVAALTRPAGAAIRIIVADNDETPSAKVCVDALRGAIPYQITYVHCPASNISLARNACIDAAAGDFIAFIDDDETASTDWLAALLAVASATGAEAVLGPVRALYPVDTPDWIRDGDFHSTVPVWVKGDIRTGYTCNVLLDRRSPLVAGRRFGLASGRTGGEDTEFFDRLHRAGGHIAFAPAAVVYEPVPEARASFSWLAKRRFRSGQTHGRLVGQEATGLGRTKAIGLAASKAAYCALVAARFALSRHRRNRWLLRGLLHAGAVSALAGMREIQQYGKMETTTP